MRCSLNEKRFFGRALRVGQWSSMCLVLTAFLLTMSISLSSCGKPDLIYMSTPELIEHWGYKVENHTIETDDDYLLTMHRIPNPNSKYYPIIVQHGILMASDTWVLRGPKEDLVLLLADRGFDIWLANTRGNHYSKKHVNYTNMQKRFWNFGWDELGKYDIPAMISHVQRVTGSPKVIHMGHSMGTTSFYAMLAKMSHMNEKIVAHLSLAPVAYMHRMRCLEVLRPVLKFIHQILEYFDRLMGHFPSGASSGMFLHFIQNVMSREFREFDYGSAMNLVKYKSPQPPPYNLTKVTAPVYLYYSTNDYLSHNLDVELLAKKLPNVKKKYLVPYKDFNHLDYLLAIDSMKLLYCDIIKTLKTFIIPQ